MIDDVAIDEGARPERQQAKQKDAFLESDSASSPLINN